MKKILATILASALGFGAWGDASVATQAEFEAAVKAASNGDTITLGEGTFTLYGTSDAKTKSLNFVGAGKDKTIWKYGKPAAGNGENGADYCFDGSGPMSFSGITFTDNFDAGSGYYRGFVRAGSLTFVDCKFTNCIGYWGTGDVSFTRCDFVVTNAKAFCMKMYSGKSFVFDTCTFQSPYGFIDAYRQNTLNGSIGCEVKDCTFTGTGSSPASKPAVRLCNYTANGEGGAWDLNFNGDTIVENVAVDSITGTNMYGCRFNDSYLPLLGEVVVNETEVYNAGEVLVYAPSPLAAPTAVTNSVQSVNLFGAIKVTGVASNMYVAVPFEGFESAGAARQAKDVVLPANLTAGTRMYVYDKSADKYDVFEVENGAWKGVAKITVLDADGKAVFDESDLTRAVDAGTGVLLERKATSESVYAYGQVPVPAPASASFAAGQTLVSPPYTNGVEMVDLNAFAWSGVNATSGHRLKNRTTADYIQFRDAQNNLVKYYYEDGAWSVVPSQVSRFGAFVADGKALVPAGTAFWYYRNGSGSATVSW